MIGTWIDEKPLYEIVKVITGSFPNGMTGDYAIADNISEIVSVEGMGYRTVSGVRWDMPLSFANMNASQVISVLTHNNNLQFRISGINDAVYKFIVIVRYTKTTD